MKLGIDNGCQKAKVAFNEYLEWLAVGIKSIKIILNPDAIILSSGITKQGEKLLSPLKAKLNKDINIEISLLQDDAGVFGSANLI